MGPLAQRNTFSKGQGLIKKLDLQFSSLHNNLLPKHLMSMNGHICSLIVIDEHNVKMVVWAAVQA
jgi:hypothetical protein